MGLCIATVDNATDFARNQRLLCRPLSNDRIHLALSPAAAAAVAAAAADTGWAKKTRTVFRFDNFVTVSPRKQSREKRYKTRISVV